MRCVDPSNVDEMVLAFLQAEVDSERFKECLHVVLGGDVGVIRSPKETAEEKARRRHALACCRGFEMNTMLFRGFPADAEWMRVALTRDDVGQLLYASYPTWNVLSGGSRRVADGASNVDNATLFVPEDPRPHISAVEKRVRAGKRFPELILAALNREVDHVVVEGHTRATAYFRGLPDDEEIEAIVGYSDNLTDWDLFGEAANSTG